MFDTKSTFRKQKKRLSCNITIDFEGDEKMSMSMIWVTSVKILTLNSKAIMKALQQEGCKEKNNNHDNFLGAPVRSSNLFSLPRQPPYKNLSHSPDVALKKYLVGQQFVMITILSRAP